MIGVVLIITVLGIVGCAGKKGKRTEKGKNIVTLRWISDANPLRKEQIGLFEKTYPGIKINLDWASNLPGKILVQMAGGSPPDLFDIYTPEQLRIFATKKALLDLSDYVRRDRVSLKDIWKNCSPWMYYKSRVYAIPDNAATIVLFYNKKLFDKAGISYPDDTWTWAKFLEVAKKLTKIDPKKRVYTQFGTGIGFLDNFLPREYGGHFYSKDGKRCMVNSKAYKKAYRFIYDLRYKYHVSPSPTEMESMASGVSGWGQGELGLFSGGRLAMFFFGRWGIINMRKIKGFEWGIVPVPYPEGGKRVTYFQSRSTAISFKGRHPEEAFKFLRFLLTKDYNETVAHGGDSFPAVISLAKSDFFLHDPAYPGETQNQVYIDAVKYSRTDRLSPYFNQLDVQRIKTEETDKMWAGIQSPEKTLDNIARRVNELREP